MPSHAMIEVELDMEVFAGKKVIQKINPFFIKLRAEEGIEAWETVWEDYERNVKRAIEEKDWEGSYSLWCKAAEDFLSGCCDEKGKEGK